MSRWYRLQARRRASYQGLGQGKHASEKSAKSLSSEIANNNTSIALVKEQLENQASLLKQLNAQLGQISNVDADFEQQLASLREKLISTALGNNGLTDQIDELRRRVTAAEEKANQVENMHTGPTS